METQDSQESQAWNVKIFNIPQDVFDGFKQYAKLKAGGKYNIALERLLEESCYLSLFSSLSSRIDRIEEKLSQPPEKKREVIKTMKGEIVIERD